MQTSTEGTDEWKLGEKFEVICYGDMGAQATELLKEKTKPTYTGGQVFLNMDEIEVLTASTRSGNGGQRDVVFEAVQDGVGYVSNLLAQLTNELYQFCIRFQKAIVLEVKVLVKNTQTIAVMTFHLEPRVQA